MKNSWFYNYEGFIVKENIFEKVEDGKHMVICSCGQEMDKHKIATEDLFEELL